MSNLLIVGICGFAWAAGIVLWVLFFMGAYANETPTPKGLNDARN